MPASKHIVRRRGDGREFVEITDASGVGISPTKLYIKAATGGKYYRLGVDDSADPKLTFTDVGTAVPTDGIYLHN